MNEIRKLIETIEKIEEGYFSELDIQNQEEARQWIKRNRIGELTLDEITRLGRESFQETPPEESEHVFKMLRKEWEEIPPRFPKKFDSARWALDYAQEHGGTATRQGNMDYSAVAKKEEGLGEDDGSEYEKNAQAIIDRDRKRVVTCPVCDGTGHDEMFNTCYECDGEGGYLGEDDEGALNDRYDDETLNCKHCGDYYCTSKFGGECPKIQKDLFDEDDNSDLEDDDSFLNDAEYEMVKTAMAKRGHTPHSLGANKKGQIMAMDDLSPGSPEYTFDEHGNVISLEYSGPDADEAEAKGLEKDADPYDNSDLEDDDTFVNDKVHAQINNELRKLNPRFEAGGYGPGDSENLIKVLVWERGGEGLDKHMVFDTNTGTFVDEEKEAFDSWLDQNPFESIEEGIKEVYISEDWPHQEETHAEMVEYWKASLSQSIVQKKVFTQLFDAANRDIDELNAAIAEQAESIADSYHGTGEGIGSSDINHFIAHIGSSLGIEDLFGWRKERLVKTGLLDDAHSEDPISVQVKSLLAQGKTVISKIAGAMGPVVSTEGRLLYIKIQGSKNPGVTSFDRRDNVEIIGNVDHYDIVEHWKDDGIDEDVGNWIKRLDRKAGDWISAKAARHMAKKVAKAVDEEGADNLGFDLSYGNKKGNEQIIAALETYLKNEPEGEYSEQIRYVLPAQAKERDRWDDIMQQAEKHLGIPADESINEGVLSWAADKLMDKVVREIDKTGMDTVVVALAPKADSMCDSLKTYLQAREPEEIGIEKYGKLIRLRTLLNCKGRVNEAVVKVPRSLRGTDPDNSLGGTSQEAEDFVNSLGPDDTVSTDVVDPETGELLDWPDKGTRRALGQKQYKRDELAKQKDADNDYEKGWDSPVLYAPNIDRNPDSAFDAINQLKYDREFLDFYNIVWKQIEDLVDAPETYAESDYDIGYEVPTAIKRTDGKKFGDQDHENFRLLNKLYRAGTYNIGLAYAGATDSGTVARFYPTFH